MTPVWTAILLCSLTTSAGPEASATPPAPEPEGQAATRDVPEPVAVEAPEVESPTPRAPEPETDVVAPPPTPTLPPTATPEETRLAQLREQRETYRTARNGFAIGGAVSAALSWGFFVGSAILVQNDYDDCVDEMGPGADLVDCFEKNDRGIDLASTSLLFSTAAVAFGSVGGIMAGKHHAARDVLEGRPERRSGIFIGTGAAAVALGAAAIIGTGVGYAIDDDGNCGGDDGQCRVRLATARFGAITAGATLTAVGAGLLAYGTTYRRSHRSWVRPAAWMDRGGGGLVLSGRF